MLILTAHPCAIFCAHPCANVGFRVQSQGGLCVVQRPCQKSAFRFAAPLP